MVNLAVEQGFQHLNNTMNLDYGTLSYLRVFWRKYVPPFSSIVPPVTRRGTSVLWLDHNLMESLLEVQPG